MTRIRHDRDTSLMFMTHGKSEFRQEVMNEVFDDFEARIAELEANNSCDGCKFALDDNTPDILLHLCKMCSRNFNANDMYQSKETK